MPGLWRDWRGRLRVTPGWTRPIRWLVALYMAFAAIELSILLFSAEARADSELRRIVPDVAISAIWVVLYLSITPSVAVDTRARLVRVRRKLPILRRAERVVFEYIEDVSPERIEVMKRGEPVTCLALMLRTMDGKTVPLTATRYEPGVVFATPANAAGLRCAEAALRHEIGLPVEGDLAVFVQSIRDAGDAEAAGKVIQGYAPMGTWRAVSLARIVRGTFKGHPGFIAQSDAVPAT